MPPGLVKPTSSSAVRASSVPGEAQKFRGRQTSVSRASARGRGPVVRFRGGVQGLGAALGPTRPASGVVLATGT